MSKKITQEDFLARCREIHQDTYDYSKTIYQGALQKITITCLIHGDFLQKSSHHLDGKGCAQCSYDGMSMSQGNFIERCHEAHHGKYDYSLTVYVRAKTKVIIICPIHGQFSQIADDHLQGHGCSKCGLDSVSDKRRMSFEEFVLVANIVHDNNYIYLEKDYPEHSIDSMKISCSTHGEFFQRRDVHLNGHGCQACVNCKPLTFEEIIARAKLFHGDTYQYLNPNMIDDHIIITCSKHGEFKQRYHDHVSGHGCAMCAFEKNADDKRLTIEQFIERSKIIHSDKYDYSQSVYIGFSKNIRIICKVHGVFSQRAENHINGHGCPICCHSISKPETLWLDTLNIAKEYRQHKIVVNGKKYNVDGFDPTTNTVYEFYGDFWHGNPEIYDPKDTNRINHKTFGELYAKTIDKENRLKEAGYQVVFIWECDFYSKTNIAA